MRAKENRIAKSASRLNPPPTLLDRGLYLLVFLLWCCVGATWYTARARLVKDHIALKLENTDGRRLVLSKVDWWKTGQAKLSNSPGDDANRTPKFGRATQTASTASAREAEKGHGSAGAGAGADVVGTGAVAHGGGSSAGGVVQVAAGTDPTGSQRRLLRGADS